MRYFFSTLVAGVVLISACGESVTIEELPDGRAYYPLEVGRVLEYRLDSIIFDDSADGNVRDTFSTFLRERIAESIESVPGDTLFLIERSFRRNTDEEWQLRALFAARATVFEAVRKEGNLDHVKMRFPLRKNTKWEPARYFNSSIQVPVGTEVIEMYSNWDGRVLTLRESESVGGFDFGDVLTVQQADDDNEIERRYSLEKYGAGVGLIFRRDSILDSRCKRLGDLLPCLEESNGALVPQPWEIKAEKGYILQQVITHYN